MSPSYLDSTFRRFRDSGDPAFLASVFDEVAPSLFALARRMAPDSSAAEDLVQETFLVALERADAWDPQRPVGPWLAGILANRARVARRRAQASPSLGELDVSVDDRPESNLVDAELEGTVVRAVKELPSRERALVAARLFDGLSGPELAERFGISHAAARARLSRGLRRLRAALPAGFALGGAAAITPSLSRVRRAVLEAAGASPSAVPTGGSTFALSAVLAAAAVVSVGAALHFGGAGPRSSGAESEVVELARRDGALPAADAEGASTGTEAGRAPVAVATPDPAVAPGTTEWRVRVVDRSSGEPLAGVPVEAGLRSGDAYAGPVLRTDSDGIAVFTLDSDIGRIRWTAGPTATLGLARVWSAEGGESDITLEVSIGGELSGRVVDSDGNPVPGANVLGWCGSSIAGQAHRVTRAGGDGRFELENLGESFVVSAEAEGFAIVHGLSGELDPGEKVTGFELELQRSTVFRGVVVDPEGAPLAGVAVVSEPSSAYRQTHHPGIVTFRGTKLATRTADDGSFQFDVVPTSDATSMRFTLAPYLVKHEWLNAAPEPVVIVLDPGRSLEGIVRAPDGSPAVAAVVGFGPYFGNLQTTESHVVTDEFGRFRIGGIRLEDEEDFGTPLYVTVVHADHAVEVIQPVDESLLVPGPGLSVRLSEGAEVLGRLIDEEARPIAAASLRIVGPRRFVPEADHGHAFSWELAAEIDTATSAADGTFAFGNLHPGQHTLTIRPPGRLRTEVVVEVATDDRVQDFVLRRAEIDRVILTGSVVDAVNGEPIETFVLAPWLGNRAESHEVESSEGRFRIPGIDPLTSKLTFRADGFAERNVEVDLPASGEFALRVELHAEVSLTYRIVDGSGAPIRRPAAMEFETLDGIGLSVRSDPGSRTTTVRTSATGIGVVHGLPAVPVRVRVTSGRDTEHFLVDLSIPAAREQVFQVDETPPAPMGELLLILRRAGQVPKSDVEHLFERIQAGEGITPEEQQTLEAALDPPRLPLVVELTHENEEERAVVTFEANGTAGVRKRAEVWMRSGPWESSGSSWESELPFALEELELTSGTWSIVVKREEKVLHQGRVRVASQASRGLTALIVDVD